MGENILSGNSNGNEKCIDNFAIDNLPAMEQWPDFINLDQVTEKSHFNAAVELLDSAVDEGFGNKIAIYSEAGNWTYADLLSKTNQLANVLKHDLGLKAGNRVIIRSPNNAMAAACWLAIVKAGGIVVTTISMLRSKEIIAIAQQSEAKFALCDNRFKDDIKEAQQNLPQLEQILYFNCEENEKSDLDMLMKSKSTTFDNHAPQATDIAMIGYTSGTTGKPKGAVHSHHAIISVCETFSKQVLQPTSDDVFSGTAPLGFVYGLGGMLLFPFHARASVVMLEDVRTKSLINAIEKYRITILHTAPTAYKALLAEYNSEQLSSLKKCVSAGEALPDYVSQGWMDKAGLRLIDGIGSTEILHIFISVQNNNDPMGTLGKPVPGYEGKVVDEDGEELPSGEVGFLAVKGPTGCRYLNDERQSSYVKNGWNITGDTAKTDENGFFWYQARTDGMIISSGYNIAGPEVEQVVAEHASVKECAVIGIPNEERGEIVCAYVVLNEGESPSDTLIKSIQDFAKQKGAPYKYPRAVKFIDALPRTLTGKVQHYILKEKSKQN